MFTFILKALIVTVFATVGYLVAMEFSMRKATKFVQDYIEMLREEIYESSGNKKQKKFK